MELDDVVTTEKAAREVHMNVRALRDIVIKNGLAIPWGGTPKHPRIKVKLSELRRFLVSRRLVIVEGKQKVIATKPKRQPQTGLHPHVTC
jgi:hypothetical protein